MRLSEMKTEIAAAIALIVMGATGVTILQTKSAAAEDKAEIKQAIKKSADDLRVEVLLNRVKALNEKKEKEGKITASEQTELDLNLEQVKAIKAEQAKK